MAHRRKAAAGLRRISPALRPLAVPIRQLHPDPGNVRRHDERNLEAIAASLTAYGQQAPVVFTRRGRRKVVTKGNGVLAAAKRLGWTHLAAVPSELTGRAARAFAIADNRASDLSEFDPELLAAQLAELADGDAGELAALGFDAEEIAELLAAPAGRQSAETPATVREFFADRPPSWTWVLIGVETVRFHEVQSAVERAAGVDGAVVRTSVTDDPADR